MADKHEEEPMIFLGGKSISIGVGYVDSKQALWFKSLGSWGGTNKIYKLPRDLITYYFGQFKLYDPNSKENQKNPHYKVYYFDLENCQEFNFSDSTPDHLVHENNTLKNKVAILQAEMEDLLNALRTNSVQQFMEAKAINTTKKARDMVGHGGGMFGHPGMVPPNQGGNRP